MLRKMAFRPEEDLICSVCHDIFKDPVVLSCSHSFCNNCVKSWWWNKQACECPVCKIVSQTRQPPRNLALKNLCESIVSRRESSEGLCSLHSEKFKLFCLDHQELACVICQVSKAHKNHRFRPVDEVAQESKDKVQVLLLPLQEKLKLFEEARSWFEEKESYIKSQAEHTEALIKEEFKKLYQFLQKEEKKRVADIRYRAKMNNKWLRRDSDELKRHIALLSETINITEEKLKAGNVTFLQNYKTAVKNIQLIQQTSQMNEPPACFGYLINVSEHLGNLASSIWTKMEETISYTPVILNPNTAHRHLHLSDDLTSLRYTRKHKVPKLPERIDYYRCVLGSKRFDSGSHSWDVEVGDSDHWGLGVAAWLGYRKKDLKSALWIIKLERNKYSAISPQDEVRLSLVTKLKKIRIHLRCDRSKLSFYDLETGAHIHSFTQIFNKDLYPYFSNGRRSPLKILPASGSTRLPPLAIIGFMVMMMAFFSFLTMI